MYSLKRSGIRYRNYCLNSANEAKITINFYDMSALKYNYVYLYTHLYTHTQSTHTTDGAELSDPPLIRIWVVALNSTTLVLTMVILFAKSCIINME